MTLKTDLSRRDIMVAAATLVATVPAQNVIADEHAAPLARGNSGLKIVQGTVFESKSGGRKREAGDPGIDGVLVSNGREVVRTGEDGRYSLPIEAGWPFSSLSRATMRSRNKAAAFLLHLSAGRNALQPRPPLPRPCANRAVARIR
jgi:hypothetical protein